MDTGFTFPKPKPPETQLPAASALAAARTGVTDEGTPSTSKPAAAGATSGSGQVRAAGRRNKVPLEKGFSQVDWLRLARSGQDMRAGHGLRRDIPMDEVRRHNTRGDAWMVLSGRVYNLTPYFPFHPGGEDVLMQAAGRDGTALFRRYHPWVNGHALLEACLLGSLKVSPGGARSPLGPGLSGSGAVATPAAAAAAVGSGSNGSGNVGGSGGGEDGGAPRQTAPPPTGSGGSGDAIT